MEAIFVVVNNDSDDDDDVVYTAWIYMYHYWWSFCCTFALPVHHCCSFAMYGVIINVYAVYHYCCPLHCYVCL